MHSGFIESDTAEQLLGRTQELLSDYRDQLEKIKSPLVATDKTWHTCALQAERIIRDCAESLRHGRADVRDRLIQQVEGLGVERATQGIDAVHSIRAGLILFDIVFDALGRAMVDSPAAFDGFQAGVRTLQRGIGRRLEAGAIGHDTYLLNTVREVNAASQRQLAREIHDHLGNHVSLALRRIELHELTWESRPDEVAARIGAVKDTLTEALGIIRDLVTQLRRADREGTLESAFTAFLESMEITPSKVRIQVNGSEEWATQDVLDEVFLVVRECLRNSLAHADAEHVLAAVDIAPYKLQALIEDDGHGFDVSAVHMAGRANGIASATERVELLGGTILFTSAPDDGGTRVTITIPLMDLPGDSVERAT
ncbi:two-component sensor histidine kinase [Streptomyces sp. A0642]|uniref:sensor histidine kinase n=1 Tax=Streptomyces sp. A0642 TaxID=2563100 RepID=UPI0010A277C2|nr:histidine kinase [Streptomyces sp. A0642]THA63896.1 two-component sensor histidine kinase [Streptomyces sp. A0642]